MLFKMIELPSDEPVTFVGCYVLKWGRVDEPTVAFREATPEEIAAEQAGAVDLLHACACGDLIPVDEYRCLNCQRESANH